MPGRTAPPSGPGMDRRERDHEPRVRGATGTPAGRGGGGGAAGRLRARLPGPTTEPGLGRGPGPGHPARRRRTPGHRRGARRLHSGVALAARRAPRPRGRRPGRPARHGCPAPDAALVDVGRVGRPAGAQRLLRLRRRRPGARPAHPRRLRGRARAQRLPVLPVGAGGGERRDGSRARLRLRLPRRQHPSLRRPRDRGPPGRRPVHGLPTAPPRPGSRAAPRPATSTSHRGWMSPTAHELVGYIREVRKEPAP